MAWVGGEEEERKHKCSDEKQEMAPAAQSSTSVWNDVDNKWVGGCSLDTLNWECFCLRVCWSRQTRRASVTDMMADHLRDGF